MSSQPDQSQELHYDDTEDVSTEGEKIEETKVKKQFEIYVKKLRSNVHLPVLNQRLFNYQFYIFNPKTTVLRPFEKKMIYTGLSIYSLNPKYFFVIKSWSFLVDNDISLNYYFNDAKTEELVLVLQNHDKHFEKTIEENKILARLVFKRKEQKEINFLIDE